jgi:hypothetical protein
MLVKPAFQPPQRNKQRGDDQPRRKQLDDGQG